MNFKNIGFVIVLMAVAIMFIDRSWWISNIALIVAAIYITIVLERKTN